VIVESLDRLSRDPEDMAGMFKRFEFNQIKIHTLNEGISTQMHVALRGITGAMQLKDIGDKVKRGQGGRVLEGKFPGAVTFGYRKVLGNPGVREINPDEAEIVRRIYREYASGMSPRNIANRLNNECIPSPSGRSPWNHVGLTAGTVQKEGFRGLLGNPLYRGELVWNAARSVINPETEKRIKRATDASEVMRVAVPHLRIIDDELWNACQTMRRSRSRKRSSTTGKTTDTPFIARKEWLLSGVLRCSVCSGHMFLVTNGPKGRRVACASAWSHNTKCEHRRTYHLDRLTDDVVARLRSVLSKPEMLKEAVRCYHDEFAEQVRHHRSESIRIDKRLAQIGASIDCLDDSLERDVNIPVDIIVGKLDKLEKERIALTEQKRLLGQDTNVVEFHPSAVAHYMQVIDNLAAALSRRDELSAEARSQLLSILGAVKVYPTPARSPHELELFANAHALLSTPMTKAARKVSEIVAESGGSARFDKDYSGKPGLPLSYQAQIVSLGRWRAAA